MRCIVYHSLDASLWIEREYIIFCANAKTRTTFFSLSRQAANVSSNLYKTVFSFVMARNTTFFFKGDVISCQHRNGNVTNFGVQYIFRVSMNCENLNISMMKYTFFLLSLLRPNVIMDMTTLGFEYDKTR